MSSQPSTSSQHQQQPATSQQVPPPQQPFRLVEAMHDEGKPLLPALLRHLERRTVRDIHIHIWLSLIK